MLIAGAQIPTGTILDCDLCIVGAGAAGLSLASEFIASPFTVIVIEAGGETWDRYADEFFSGEVIDPRHPGAALYRQRRLGGTTTVWGGRCVPLDPVDFEQRPHVPLSGWPFSFGALAPYYHRAQQLLEAGGFNYSARTALNGRPFVHGLVENGISTDSIERYSPPTNVWRKHRKALRRSARTRVISGITCAGFQTRFAGETVEAARCLKEDGGEVFVRARSFVAAVGGLETVRLLSADDDRRGVALGDHSGMLGRTYMCHIEAGVGELRFTPPDRHVNFTFDRTDDGVYANRRFSLSRTRQDELGVMNAVVRLHHPSVVDPAHGSPILSAVYIAKRLLPESRRKLTVLDHANIARIEHDAAFWSRHALNVARGAPRLAVFGAEWALRRYMNYRRVPYVAFRSPSGGYALDYNGEQAPDPESRVTLARERDRFGLHRLVIDWRANDLDRRTARATLGALRDSIAASKCGVLTFDEDELDDACAPLGGHHIGTARMAASPRKGVTDANCKLHYISNLFLAGSAVFPTSGHANPTLTIVALACRLADHLKTILFDLDGPSLETTVSQRRVAAR